MLQNAQLRSCSRSKEKSPFSSAPEPHRELLSPTDKQESSTAGEHPTAGNKRTMGDRELEPPGRRETRQGSESIKETFTAPHTGPARIIYCRFRCYVLNLITEKL